MTHEFSIRRLFWFRAISAVLEGDSPSSSYDTLSTSFLIIVSRPIMYSTVFNNNIMLSPRKIR